MRGPSKEPEDHEALAEAIGRLYRDRDFRRSLGSAGLRDVERYEMDRVAARFLLEISKVAPVFYRDEDRRVEDIPCEERRGSENSGLFSGLL